MKTNLAAVALVSVVAAAAVSAAKDTPPAAAAVGAAAAAAAGGSEDDGAAGGLDLGGDGDDDEQASFDFSGKVKQHVEEAMAAKKQAPSKEGGSGGLSTAEKLAQLKPTTPWKPYTGELPKGTFVEQFPNKKFDNWKPSQAKKEDLPVGGGGSDDDDDALWRYRGEWALEEATALNGAHPGDLGLVLKSPAAHHAISRKLATPIEFQNQDVVVLQYEVKLQAGLECGGGYLKALTAQKDFKPEAFSDKTPYTIMFGPDRCGATNKVHFIFRHKNKKTGEIAEHHLRHMVSMPPAFSKETHLYTLKVHPKENTYEILIDNVSKQKGSLLEDFDPPVVPPKEIDDPEDSKPSDWVDEAKIPDPKATKPADWDEDAPAVIPDMDATKPADWLEKEPLLVPDPSAVKPEDWDDDDDGEWVAPTVSNPKCAEVSGCGPWVRPTKKNPAFKGKWFAPLIDNPEYKGEWAPRKIPNPAYVEETHPGYMSPIGAVGLELWTMQKDILFDNVLIAPGVSDGQLDAWTKATWVPKHEVEVAMAKIEEPSPADDDDEAKGTGSDLPTGLTWSEQLSPSYLKRFVEAAWGKPSWSTVQAAPVAAAAVGAAVLTVLAALASAVLGRSSSAAAPTAAARPSAAQGAKKKAPTTTTTTTTTTESTASPSKAEGKATGVADANASTIKKRTVAAKGDDHDEDDDDNEEEETGSDEAEE